MCPVASPICYGDLILHTTCEWNKNIYLQNTNKSRLYKGKGYNQAPASIARLPEWIIIVGYRQNCHQDIGEGRKFSLGGLSVNIACEIFDHTPWNEVRRFVHAHEGGIAIYS